MLLECDSRTNDGITVCLWWESETGATSISVEIPRNEITFVFEVSNADARETFYHPFACLPNLSEMVGLAGVTA